VKTRKSNKGCRGDQFGVFGGKALNRSVWLCNDDGKGRNDDKYENVSESLENSFCGPRQRDWHGVWEILEKIGKNTWMKKSEVAVERGGKLHGANQVS